MYAITNRRGLCKSRQYNIIYLVVLESQGFLKYKDWHFTDFQPKHITLAKQLHGICSTANPSYLLPERPTSPGGPTAPRIPGNPVGPWSPENRRTGWYHHQHNMRPWEEASAWWNNITEVQMVKCEYSRSQGNSSFTSLSFFTVNSWGSCLTNKVF